MPPKVNVAGSVELHGHEVRLCLSPASVCPSSSSPTCASHPAALLDQHPPSTKQIVEQVRQGTLPCHPSRQELSAQEVGQRIYSIQSSLALWPRGLQGAWSTNAGERLQQWLRTAKQGQKRKQACQAMVAGSDEDSSSDSSSSSDLAPLKAELAELLEAVGCHQEIEKENDELQRLNAELVKENDLLRRKLEAAMFRKSFWDGRLVRKKVRADAAWAEWIAVLAFGNCANIATKPNR